MSISKKAVAQKSSTVVASTSTSKPAAPKAATPKSVAPLRIVKGAPKKLALPPVPDSDPVVSPSTGKTPTVASKPATPTSKPASKPSTNVGKAKELQLVCKALSRLRRAQKLLDAACALNLTDAKAFTQFSDTISNLDDGMSALRATFRAQRTPDAVPAKAIPKDEPIKDVLGEMVAKKPAAKK
jgi:hypothetical protein